MPQMILSEKIKSNVVLQNQDIQKFNKFYGTNFEKLTFKVSFGVYSCYGYSSVGNLKVKEVNNLIDSTKSLDFIENSEKILGKGKTFKKLVDSGENFECKEMF